MGVRLPPPPPLNQGDMIKKILIVDDDEVNIDILLDYFEDYKSLYLIETATSGTEAVKKYKWFFPDIILLDVVLGDCSGYDLCVRVKNSSTPKMPIVILISGKSLPEDIERGMFAGADHYITKPYHIDELMESIKSLTN